MIYGFEDYKADPWLAVDSLSAFLDDGALALFLGAGASLGFGLPGWHQLVARLTGVPDHGPEFEEMAGKSDKELSKAIDDIDDGTDTYIEALRSALYRDVSDDLGEQLQRSPLLLAVTALVTGSARGRIDTITTYNFDDLIEQYLQMLGYGILVRTNPSALAVRADVAINHVHGFVPQRSSASSKPEEIVLSARSFREKQTQIDEGWPQYVVGLLHSKVGLFLGLSGDDDSILNELNRAKKRVKRPGDYLGYWLLTPGAFDRNHKSLLDVDICPIRLEKQDIPSFLFRVCQQAAPPARLS